ncbi:MAG TPA: hypothetical protein VKQ36_12310 [Ktedonobacterales bacterium]|nr:hypothetical protein [Ktedonobacterales bacterium]
MTTSNAPARQPATPRPASATVLLRQGADGRMEAFMVRRHVQSEFVPDVFVFPGGSVKEADRVAEQVAGLCAPVTAPERDGPTALGAGFRAAALRELFEEAGVLLAWQAGQPLAITTDSDITRFGAYRDALNAKTATLADVARQEGLTLATDALLHWAHWITPAAWPKRFDTHFFLAEMPARQEAAHDALETTAGTWITPEDALARFEGGDFPLVFATIHQLRALTGLTSYADAQARFAGVIPSTVAPRIIRRAGATVILLPNEPILAGDQDVLPGEEA